MESQSLRLRLVFEDPSILSQSQRSEGMHRSWLLVKPEQHRKISDVSSHLLHIFNLYNSCPNGILLSMDGFVLPPFESTQIFKDKEIVCVKRKGEALAYTTEGVDASNLLENMEFNNREHVDNGLLLLANEEFDKETGGYQSESEDVEEQLEDEPSSEVAVSKKRKASTKLRSSKKKKHRLRVMDAAEDEIATEEVHVNNDGSFPRKISSKEKIKPNAESNKGSAETSNEKVECPPIVKRKKKHRLRVMDGAEDDVPTEEVDIVNNDESHPRQFCNKEKINPNEESYKGSAETSNGKVESLPNVKRREKLHLRVIDGAEGEVATEEIDNVNNDKTLPKQILNKKKIKSNEEGNKGSAETSDEKVESSSKVKRSQHVQENVEEVKEASTAPDGSKKVPSRSARRKKAKRLRLREVAKISQKPDPHLKPEVAKAENEEANCSLKGDLHQKKVPEKPLHMNKQEENNHNDDDMDAEVVPIVVRPGHIRFEPLDEDQAEKQADVSYEVFQWNGITSKKKGQKWGTEKFQTPRRNDTLKTSKESSKISTSEADVPVIGLNDFDKLPPCSSPKKGDVIAYRILELSSSWTPEFSSFRVGRISSYDGGNIVLMPVPDYPIVSEKMDEGPDNSLYGEDGSLEIKFSSLVDVRNVKQSTADAMEIESNGFDQTPQGDEKDVAPKNLVPSNVDNKENVNSNPVVEKREEKPEDEPVVENKKENLWDELNEAINAKKSELLEEEEEEETKRNSGRNPWSYRALRGSALGPTMAMLRSQHNI